ncbi:TadE/TadG family type IV pilus assembly protein [Streptomyces sp. NBC_01508]|uniref:TadE/TadG family type IV pilus assembly protein n=1 Tax=Streptomyces sp. NBC_01508 TaxID=2903888 RepID=UPI0038687894
MPKRFPRTEAQLTTRTGTGATVRTRTRATVRTTAEDKGQAAIEFAGLITLLLLVGLAAIQLGIAAYAVQQAGTASRAAARAASQQDPGYAEVGRSSMSDWLGENADIGPAKYFGDEITVTAEVPVPSIVPLFDFPEAKRSATMPRD